MDPKKIERGTRLVLEGLGVDLKDPNFAGTPKRVARFYMEMFRKRPFIMRTFPEDNDQMIILRNYEVHTLCPHHLLPVVMRVFLAYIPNGRVLGLSKLGRVVESELGSPIMQETLGRRIVDRVQLGLRPKGVACTIVGVHGCMRHRGIRTNGDVVSSAISGVFLSNPAARDEFLRLIGRM